MPKLVAYDLRRASISFRRKTAHSDDGFKMRHYALIDDSLLCVLAVILSICEQVGNLPGQVRRIIFALLPKPKGGFRPIAIFVAP